MTFVGLSFKDIIKYVTIVYNNKILGTLMSRVSQRYLKFQGIQKVPKVSRYSKDIYRFKVSKMYLKVQGIYKVPKGPMYSKGT